MAIVIVLDSPKHFFDLFGLPVGFAIDPEQLNTRYLQLLAMTHAARFIAAGDPEAPAPACSPSELDAAYRTLRDPLSRAGYLLNLWTDWTAPAGAEPGPPVDRGDRAAFLMERMELRETLAEAASRPDPEAAVASVLTQLAEESLALDKTLQGLFADPSPANLQLACEIVRQLRFLGQCRRDAEDRQSGPPARP